jgi:hypothetical protein
MSLLAETAVAGVASLAEFTEFGVFFGSAAKEKNAEIKTIIKVLRKMHFILFILFFH